MDFEEIVLHKQLKDYTISLSSIAGVIKPDQRMCNAICEIIATAANTQPTYVPYVVACYRSAPWIVPSADHEKALIAFDKKMKNFHSVQPLSMQQFLLYKWRFVIAADICSAWKDFGGIAARINFIALLTNMSIVDNPFVAMKYDEALNNRLANYARERTPGIDYPSLLSMEDFELKRSIIVANPIHVTNDGRPTASNEVSQGSENTDKRANAKRFQKRK